MSHDIYTRIAIMQIMDNDHATAKDRIELIISEQQLSGLPAFCDSIERPYKRVQKWMERGSIPKDGAQAISDRFGYAVHWVLGGELPKFKAPGSQSAEIIDILDSLPPQKRAEMIAWIRQTARLIVK